MSTDRERAIRSCVASMKVSAEMADRVILGPPKGDFTGLDARYGSRHTDPPVVSIDARASAEARKRITLCRGAMIAAGVALGKVEVFRVQPIPPLPEMSPIEVKAKPYWQRSYGRKRARR